MIRLIRGWRVLRVGRGRVLRIALVAILFVLIWLAIFSKNEMKISSRSRHDAATQRSPVLHGAAPVRDPVSSAIPVFQNVEPPAQPHLSPEANKGDSQWKEREAVLRNSDNINPHYEAKVMKDKLKDLQLKPVRNQHFLHQNQLDLMADYKDGGDYNNDYDESDEDEEDEGKWNGRNKNDNVDDVAIEEDDDIGDHEDDYYELEDVGGEKLKKRGNDDAKDYGLEDVGGEKLKKRDNDDVKDYGLDDIGGEKLKKKDNDDAKDYDLDDVAGEKLKKRENFDAKLSKRRKKEKKLLEKKNVAIMEYANHIGERLDEMNEDQVKFNEVKELKDKYIGNEDEEIGKELNQRKSRVKEVCAKYALGPHAAVGEKPLVKHPPTPNYDIFFIDRRDELAWCPIYKAASTSWLYNFLILGGMNEEYIKSTKEQISHKARKVWPSLDYKDAEKAFKSCLKFMIVRHPFERLVSAFRDKLENTNIGKEHGVDHFYKKYGRKIVSKYRPVGQGLPAIRYSQDMDDPSIPAPKGIEPTFGEFVKYLIATDLVYYSDDHWMPYYLHCTPCLLDYDVIAKFETLERDQNYIIEKKHLEDKIKPSWKHLTKGVKTSDTVGKYFATITKRDLMDLYEKYKLDFELFDYSLDEYLSYVRDA